MNKILKFFPVALAALTLASCSNDDLFGEKTAESVLTAGDLQITFDPLDNENAATRALRPYATSGLGALMFEEGDQINVYDDQLYKYDIYKRQNKGGVDGFFVDGDKILDAPKYAIYPGEMVQRGYYDRNTGATKAEIAIPRVIKYDKDNEIRQEDGTVAYRFDLPMFGYASEGANDVVAVSNLRHLTAILVLKLEKAYSNASWIRIVQNPDALGAPGEGTQAAAGRGHQKLSGTFVADLDPDPEKRANVKLEEGKSDLVTYEDIYIDLRAVPSNSSVLYIPIVPGLDGDLDDICLQYTNDADLDETETPWDAAFNSKWTTIPGMKFPNKTFTQNKIYRGTAAFEFEEMSPNKVTQLLAQYQDAASDIVIDVTKSFTVADDAVSGTVIKMPNFTNNVNVSLNILGTTWTNSAVSTLTIQDADAADPFTGNFTLNVDDNISSVTAAQSISINIPEGDAQLIGDYSGFGTNAELRVLAANNFIVGDGETTTKIDGTGLKLQTLGEVAASTYTAGPKAVNIMKLAEVTADIDATGDDIVQTESIIMNGTLTGDILGGKYTKAITVDADGTMTGAITGNELTNGNDEVMITVNGAVTGDVTSGQARTSMLVVGKVTGDVDFSNAVKGKITITGTNPEAPATPVAAQVAGAVTTRGDVEIALTAEAEAITGNFTMQGADKELKLVQGYLPKLVVDVNNTGSWEDKYINMTLNDEKEGRAAILEIVITKENHINYTESVWDGKKITNVSYANKSTKVSYNGTSLTAAGILTASQLATIDKDEPIRLINEFDLKNKDTWTGIKAKNVYGDELKVKDGAVVREAARRTIYNLNLTNASAKGLINELTGTEVYDIAIEDVKCEKAADTEGLSALIGSVTGSAAYTIKNVSVIGMDVKAAATKKLTKFGGLVAVSSANACTILDCTVKGGIDGYHTLGGLIGEATGNVTIDGSTAGVTIYQTYNSGNTMDIEYAKVGGFIGTINNTSATVKIGATKQNSAALALKNSDIASKMYISHTTAGIGKFYKYTSKQSYIGYCGAGTTPLPWTFDRSNGVWIDPGTTQPWVTYGNYSVPVVGKNDDNSKIATWDSSLQKTVSPNYVGYQTALYDFFTEN